MPDIDSGSSDFAFDPFCTVTIQGGGIYGLSLLGQLRALEQENLIPIIYAGTSAGAIIAALAWAGYSAEDILAELADLARRNRLVPLLGRFAYDAKGRPLVPARLGRIAARCAALADSFGERSEARVLGRTATFPLPRTPLLGRAALALAFLVNIDSLRSVGSIVAALRRGGIFEGHGFERWVDDLLRRKLDPDESIARSRLLTFNDCFQIHYVRSQRYQPALFMTVTDLGRREPLLINSLDPAFRDVPVAGAVRASAGFPAAFTPRHLRIERTKAGAPTTAEDHRVGAPMRAEAGRFVDGGVMANFPLWLVARRFRETLWQGGRLNPTGSPEPLATPLRALAFRPVLHIGLRVVDRQPDPATDRIGDVVDSCGALGRPWGALRSIGEMMTGGARTLLEDQLLAPTQRKLTVTQARSATGAPGGVLAVDRLTPYHLKTMFDLGKVAAQQVFRGLSFDLPRGDVALSTRDGKRSTVLERLEELIAAARYNFCAMSALPDPAPRANLVRANLFIPQASSLTMIYHAGFAGDPDAGLRFPVPTPAWPAFATPSAKPSCATTNGLSPTARSLRSPRRRKAASSSLCRTGSWWSRSSIRWNLPAAIRTR